MIVQPIDQPVKPLSLAAIQALDFLNIQIDEKETPIYKLLSRNTQGKPDNFLFVSESNFLIETGLNVPSLKRWLEIVKHKEVKLNEDALCMLYSPKAQEEFSILDKWKSGKLEEPDILSFVANENHNFLRMDILTKGKLHFATSSDVDRGVAHIVSIYQDPQMN